MRPSACTLSSDGFTPAAFAIFCCSVLHLHKWPDRPRHCPRQDRHATDLLRLLQHVPLQNPLQERCHAADQKCTVRDEPVLHAVHQKSLLTEQRTKILVKFLISEKQPSPMDIDNHWKYLRLFPFWTISVQTVRFVFILCICDICFKNHSLRKVVFFISLHTGFFKIISLF